VGVYEGVRCGHCHSCIPDFSDARKYFFLMKQRAQMSNNKILLYFTSAVILTSCFLTGIAVGWEDHPDIAGVDHLFDIHVDYDRMVEDAKADKARSENNDRIQKEWAKDLSWSDDRGTCQYTPDRDK